MQNKTDQPPKAVGHFVYNENHARGAWLKRGFADEQKRNIRESDKNSYIEERKLAENSREGKASLV